MNIWPVIDVAATGQNIVRLRKRAGLTVKDLQVIFGFGTPQAIVDILPLCFADADRPGTDVYGRDAGIQDLMSDKDAERIVEFLTRHPNVDVIVHCDAGISRSSGVAAAILKYLTGDDSSIFDNARLHPNMWCNSTL